MKNAGTTHFGRVSACAITARRAAACVFFVSSSCCGKRLIMMRPMMIERMTAATARATPRSNPSTFAV